MKHKIMLIGDSIRMGYQDEVIKELGENFEVWGPEENARFAKFTLNSLADWFKQCGTPEVIHWNNGLWDSAIVCKEDGMFTPPEEYVRYMKLILRELRKQTPHVIFATTTPVRDHSLNQKLEYVQMLNAAILPVMREQSVPVNDLYSLVFPEKETLICDDRIHLSPDGKKVAAKAVADAIRAQLR